jgi:hypothetical protein
MPKPSPPEPSAYVSWDDAKGRARAFAGFAKAIERVRPALRAHGSDIFFNVGPGNVSVRDGFNRYDYENFRRDEGIPRKPKDIIMACMSAYENVGLLRNVVDLMTDFAVKGVDLVHPNERIEAWHKEWAKKIFFADVSSRFVKCLIRDGQSLPKRQTAKLQAKHADQMKRARGAEGPDVEIQPEVPVGKREIPWRYTFMNPLSVEMMSEDLAAFVGPDGYQFALKIPTSLINKVKQPRTAQDKILVGMLPGDVRKMLMTGQKLLPLDPTKFTIYYYKRDDWQVWAKPMAFSILADLNLLQKMRLADLSALDGAISSIRVWKLGNLEARIMPSEHTIMRLADMLTNNVGGGVMDLVWGPDIELVETSTEVHRFLGEGKYAPVLNAIYAGLGIPPSLTGSDSKSGFTNNFIALKTLTERLEYVRSVLRTFWEAELKIVQRAMGFRFPATLTFDHNVLTDDSAQKQLLLHLADRDLISIEALQEEFGLVPEIEEVRIRREARRRQAKLLPPKASPYHDPQQEYGLKKIFAQTGSVTPSQVGVELDESKPGEITPIEHTAKFAPKPSDARKGQPGQGRPKGKKDGKKRKQKVVKPRTSARFVTALAWAEEAQGWLAKHTSAAYLKSLGKKTLRELTAEEAAAFAEFRFALLCQFQPGAALTTDSVKAALARPLSVPAHVAALLEKTVARYAQTHGKPPPVETLRHFQAAVCALNAEEVSAA